MSEFNWTKIADKVTFIVKTNSKYKTGGSEYTQALILIEHSKAQLNTAISWATKYSNDKADYKLIELPNDGFNLEIIKSAGQSSGQGKLSFWNCLITSDTNKEVNFLIGINAELLVDLIRNCTIVNGFVTEKLVFFRKDGQVGATHKGTEMYKKAMADVKLKENMSKAKKTKKWELGKRYSTISKEGTLIAEVYSWLDPIYESRRGCKYFVDFNILDKPIKKYLVLTKDEIEDLNSLNENILPTGGSSLSNLYNYLTSLGERNMETFDNHSYENGNFGSIYYNLVEHSLASLPSRSLDCEVFIADHDNLETELSRLVKTLNQFALRYYKGYTYSVSEHVIEGLLLTDSADVRPAIIGTEEFKGFMASLKHFKDIPMALK